MEEEWRALTCSHDPLVNSTVARHGQSLLLGRSGTCGLWHAKECASRHIQLNLEINSWDTVHPDGLTPKDAIEGRVECEGSSAAGFDGTGRPLHAEAFQAEMYKQASATVLGRM